MVRERYKSTVVALLASTAIAILGASATAKASCTSAQVTMVMDYPTQCGGKGAFATSGSGGFWICATGPLEMTLVTAALLSGRSINYQLGGGDNDCNPDNHYLIGKVPLYLLINAN